MIVVWAVKPKLRGMVRPLAPCLAAALVLGAALTATASAAPPPPTCAVAGPQPTIVREPPNPPQDITADGYVVIACSGATPVSLVVDQAPHDGYARPGDGAELIHYAISHPGYVGPDSFTVHGHSADGDSAPVTVDVDVTKAPEPGPACPKQFTAPTRVRSGEGRTLSLPCPGAVGARIVAGPDHGSLGAVTPGADGVLRLPYAADRGYTGGDHVLVAALDAAGQGSDPKVLAVAVVDPSANAAPLCVSPILPFGFPEPVGGPAELATTCSDPDGDPLSYAITRAPGHGTVVPAATPERLLYTPTPGFTGTDGFGYVVSDGHGGATANDLFFTVATPPIKALPPLITPPPLPTLRSDATVRLRATTAQLRLTASAAGRLTIGLGLPHGKTLATFTRTLRAGTTTLNLRLPKALRTTIARHHATTLALRAKLRTKDGHTASATRTVKLRRR
jgi:hypothetical protein